MPPAATSHGWALCVYVCAGVRTGTQVKLGSNSTMERFINTLDNYMQVCVPACVPL